MLFEVIEKNKRKSILALFVMGMWYCLIYGFIFAVLLLFWMYQAAVNHTVYSSVILGFLISSLIFILLLWTRSSNHYASSGFELYKTDKYNASQLYNIAEEISIAAGISKISIYILNSNILNAYAYGYKIEKSSVIISKGLLEILSREELQGIIAHEISHIINRDTRYILCAGILYDISSAFTYYDSAASGNIFKSGSLLPLPLALLSRLAQEICRILLKFISKECEYLADACAVLYTRNPEALASAMRKIEQASKNNIYQKEAESANLLIKASFFAPVKGDNTHPDTESRIKILENLKSADLNEYEKEYQKLFKKGLLPKSALENSTFLPLINPLPSPPQWGGSHCRQAKRAVQGRERVITSSETACNLASVITNQDEIQAIKENKEILKENIKKHREVNDFVHSLADYKIIECECRTKLKIPPVYRNSIIICPHCGKKHICR